MNCVAGIGLNAGYKKWSCVWRNCLFGPSQNDLIQIHEHKASDYQRPFRSTQKLQKVVTAMKPDDVLGQGGGVCISRLSASIQ